MDTISARLQATGLTLAYEQKVIARDLSVQIPDRKFTVIIGPNACGKSTLLRSLCRLLRPRSGQVLLDGQDIHQMETKALARQLGLLPQHAIVPEGISVADLVARGRYPHQSLLRQWSEADHQAVEAAMAATNVSDLAQRSVDELSGGQRQRVFLAMALAQQTPLLLLDEPTTYLDINHQVELMALLHRQQQQGKTVVTVLHDLNQASRYCDHLVLMAAGRIVASGSPRQVMTPDLLRSVFSIDAEIHPDPISARPMCVVR